MSHITGGSGSNITSVPDRGATQAAAQVTVGTTEVTIRASNTARKTIVVYADDANTGNVFLGPTGVLTTTGLRLSAKSNLATGDYTGAIIGIGSAAGQVVDVWEVTT